MQKVFRLLRDNNESGPFTIGELLQQKIGPDDLIWVDGESTAWAYPQEMDNLKYALSTKDLLKKQRVPKEVPKPVAKKPKVEIQSAIHLSPNTEIERKAEELRQRTLSYRKVPGYEPTSWAHQQPVQMLPLADDVDFVYHKKKGLPVGEVLMGAMVVTLLTLGWYGGGKNLFRQPTEVASAVAVKLNTTEENAAIGSPVPATDSIAVATNRTQNLLPADTTDVATTGKYTQRKPVKAVVKDTDLVKPKEEPATAMQTPGANQGKKEDSPNIKQPVVKPEAKEDAKAEQVTAKKADEQLTTEPEEKKKGFHLFKGLFKKKKKGDDKPEEDNKAEGQ